MTIQQIAEAQVMLNHAYVAILPVRCAAFSEAWDRMVLDYGVTAMNAAALIARPNLKAA